MKKTHPPIYGTNPIDPLCLASEIVKIYFQGLVNCGYTISEVESREVWKLEKGKTLSEQISEIKNNKERDCREITRAGVRLDSPLPGQQIKLIESQHHGRRGQDDEKRL